MTDTFNVAETRKLLASTRKLLVKNITSGLRPGEDELLLMSEPYCMVWEQFVRSDETDSDPDWADILDPPKSI